MRSLLGDHLLQRLQQDTEGTLHQRLFRCLRSAIVEGVLQPKTRLPASRDLAGEIHVSRNTVLSAYEQLQAEGYVEARTGHGTWVAEKLPEAFLNSQKKQTPLHLQSTNHSYTLSHRGASLVGYAAASPHQWGGICAGCTRCHRISASYF